MRAMAVLDTALNYADDGFHLFPLDGKVPRVRGGLHAATTDHDQIRAWWAQWPGANIGVATGRISDLAVLDLDGVEGELALTELQGDIPPTRLALTGNGCHLWFRMPPFELRNSAGRIGPHIDVRADGGYVVAPPSIHPNGEPYWFVEVEPTPLAPWPEWLCRPERQSPFSSRLENVPLTSDRYAAAALRAEVDEVARAAPGTRNDRLNSAAYSLARFVAQGTLRGRAVADALIAAALRSGLTEQEAERTVASAFVARRAS
jgi:bifunctional DNA primase/polymerase-like protein